MQLLYDRRDLMYNLDLPAALESASSLADLVPSYVTPSSPPTVTVTEHAASSSSSTTTSTNNDVNDMVERLLQFPPYSNRIQTIEQSIVTTQRRIREQISQLEWGFASSSIVTPPDIATENRNSSSVSPILRGPHLRENFVEHSDSRSHS